MSNEVARRNPAVVKFEATLASVMPTVAQGFPMSIPEDKLRRATDRLMFAIKTTAVSNSQIYECTAASVANCICLSALTGLVPGGAVPMVDLIPRRRSIKDSRGNWNKVLELQWQIGWRGYKALGEKLGADIEPRLVFHGDKYEVRFGLNPDLIHVPDPDAERTWDNLRCGYIIIRLPGGKVKFTDLTKAEIEKRRNVSQAYQYDVKDNKSASPWSQWPLEMALKTLVSYAARRGYFPLDGEFTMAMEMDGREVPDDLIIDTTSAPAAAPTPAPKALADIGGMAALSGRLNERSEERRPAPRRVDNTEQPPPEYQAEPEASPLPAGETDPQSASDMDLPLGGGSQVSGPNLTQVQAAEQRLSPLIVGDIRKELGIRSNARLENVDGGLLDRYLQVLSEEYNNLYPED